MELWNGNIFELCRLSTQAYLLVADNPDDGTGLLSEAQMIELGKTLSSISRSIDGDHPELERPQEKSNTRAECVNQFIYYSLWQCLLEASGC